MLLRDGRVQCEGFEGESEMMGFLVKTKSFLRNASVYALSNSFLSVLLNTSNPFVPKLVHLACLFSTLASPSPLSLSANPHFILLLLFVVSFRGKDNRHSMKCFILSTLLLMQAMVRLSTAASSNSPTLPFAHRSMAKWT